MSAPAPAPTEAETVDLLTTRALWSAGAAATIRAVDPGWAWGGHVLRPALAALVDEHDLQHTGAPVDGPARVASIWTWIQDRAGHVAAAALAHQTWRYARRDGSRAPEPVDPWGAAATNHARREGLPDPGLIRHAAAVLQILPALVAPDTHTTATTSQLLKQLHHQRAANLAGALA